MGPIDHQELNEQFLSRIGYLSLIGVTGPYREYNLTQRINNVKVIDDPAEVAAGDIAYGGNRVGRVVSNALSAGKRTITVKYGPIDRPAGVSAAEWAADYDTLAFQTDKHVISVVDETNATGNVIPNPYLRLASISVLFARPTPPAEIIMEDAAPIIAEDGGNTSLNFNVAAVSVQKKVNGVNSGSAVVANGAGVASMPNGDDEGDKVEFVVSKLGYETVTYGPYTVGEALALVSMVPEDIQEGGPATALTFNKPGVSVQKKVATVNSGAPVVANGAGLASVPNGNTTGQSITFLCTLNAESLLLGPYVVLAP